jgi:mannose-1-phosphate guanylyltransferase
LHEDGRLPVNAMILAAGFGTRLGGLGRETPKVLIEIGGSPLLERHLLYLERLGVGRVVINVHHHADRVRAFAEAHTGPLEIVCVVEEELLGTAGGVRNALPWLEPGPFVVLYGDVLVEEPVDAMVELHRHRRAAATIAVHKAGSAAGKGVVEVDDDARVTRFAEKAATEAGPVLVNSGLYVLERDLIAPLEVGVFKDFGHDVLPSAIDAGLSVYAHRLSNPVIDIGTPEGLALARSTAETERPGPS